MARAPAEHDAIELLLAAWEGSLGDDSRAYRGHVYRVFHFCIALLSGASEEEVEKITVATVFHDLGIWSGKTMDYLEPSARLAAAHLREAGHEAWEAEVSAMIMNHHKLRPYRAQEHARLAEAFRRADLVDVSLGNVRFGLDRDYVRAVRQAFPAHGFCGRITGLVLGWGLRHPLRPLPMMKW